MKTHSERNLDDPGLASLNASIEGVCGQRYRIVSHLGSGAFGVVYRADDTLLNRTVAIKRIRVDALAASNEAEEARRRFLREAQVAAQLQHSNIVTIFDIIARPDESLIVMEFVEGLNLQRKLASAKSKSLPLSETIHILSRVAEALHYAHEQEVVHRDIKPANILVSHSGAVKVTDFGIAKAESSNNLTTTGSIMGTPDYMSPEQARGQSVDGRSDLFSLGCIMYQCLTGVTPFHSSNVTGILIRIVSDDPAPIDFQKLGLPYEVQTILERALAKDPSLRFESGAQFAEALRSLPQNDFREPDILLGSTEEKGQPHPDSVADSLMKEARSTTEIQPLLIALKKEKRRLCAAASPLLQLKNVTLTSQEAYILSRVDGKTIPADILSVSPVPEEETARSLLGFIRAGLISFENDQATRTAPPQENPKNRPRTPERSLEETIREIEHLYELSQNQDDWQVLGVEPTASLQEIKRAFQQKAFRFHPDRYTQVKDAAFHRKLSFLFTRVSHAFAFLSDRAQTTPPPQPERADPTQAKVKGGKHPPSDGSPHHASSIFREAKMAFENKDFWRSIELCQKALEIDASKADYFYLLGLGLSENPKWAHDAEKNLRKATDLEPSRPEYLVALGKLYRSQGLSSRARQAFQKARAIDPDYPIDDNP